MQSVHVSNYTLLKMCLSQFQSRIAIFLQQRILNYFRFDILDKGFNATLTLRMIGTAINDFDILILKSFQEMTFKFFCVITLKNFWFALFGKEFFAIFSAVVELFLFSRK